MFEESNEVVQIEKPQETDKGGQLLLEGSQKSLEGSSAFRDVRMSVPAKGP